MSLQEGETARLILLILFASGAHCDSHVLRCYETMASSPAPGLPVYSVVVYLDDKMIANYTSDNRRFLPKVEWLKKLEAEYWELERKRSLKNQHSGMQGLQNLMKRLNETKGFHVYQVMYGCELRDDGSTVGYQQRGYDGRDFLYLDTKSGIYIPIMNEAQITTQLWNNLEMGRGKRNKYELENDCVDYLNKFIVYGRTELEKRVPPEVKVWGNPSNGQTKLYCLAYGFHPRAVEVKWMRNGVDLIISTEDNPILPHPDGTYQMRVSVEVPMREEDSYSCHVDHSSLEEPLVVVWDPNKESKIRTIIASVALGVVLSIAAAVGFILYRRRSETSY